MAEPLTFKFVFADESEPQGAPQAPPEAQPGAAQRANPTPQGQRQPPPQSRPAPQPNASPAQPPSRPPGNPPPAQPESSEPRRPRRTTGRQPERAPEAGEAQRVLSDLIRHLSTLPTVGGAIGTLSRIAEPLLKARDQIEALAERRRAAEERQAAAAQGAHNPPEMAPRRRRTPQPSERLQEDQAEQTPAPKPQPSPQQPQAAPQAAPAPRPPDPEPEEKAAPGTVRNPTPGSAAAAMEQLITALGPLPQGQKELAAALRPLEALGYTLKELKAAVDRMRQQQARPQQPQAVPTGARPPKPGAATITTADIRGANRPPKPGAATITAADIRPGSAPAPGGAAAAGAGDVAAGDAAAGAGAAEAAGAGAVAAGAAGGPVGLVAGIAVVAAVGAATRAFSALTGSVEKIDRSFTELSSRLAPFNGRLAFAQAQARTQQTLLDIERAGRLGGDLAKFTDERARLSREFQRLATELEAAVLPAVNGAAELLADTVQGIRESMSAASELIGGLLSGMSLSEASTAAATNGMKKHLDAQEADRKSKEMMDIAGVFFGEQGQQKGLNIGGVNYGSANDWADYIPQAAPRRVNNQRAFGGI